MSYSFDVKDKTKAAARAGAENFFDKNVLPQQPVHSHDKDAAFKNVDNHLALLAEPKEDEEVVISMHGSVSVDGATAGRGVVGASSGCNVYLRPAQA